MLTIVIVAQLGGMIPIAIDAFHAQHVLVQTTQSTTVTTVIGRCRCPSSSFVQLAGHSPKIDFSLSLSFFLSQTPTTFQRCWTPTKFIPTFFSPYTFLLQIGLCACHTVRSELHGHNPGGGLAGSVPAVVVVVVPFQSVEFEQKMYIYSAWWEQQLGRIFCVRFSFLLLVYSWNRFQALEPQPFFSAFVVQSWTRTRLCVLKSTGKEGIGKKINVQEKKQTGTKMTKWCRVEGNFSFLGRNRAAWC